MKKFSISLFLPVILIAFISIFLLFSGGRTFAGEISQRSFGGGVDIEINFLNYPDIGEEAELDHLNFQVYMDTHSGDLTDKDFLEMLDLTFGSRKIDQQYLSWEWESKSDHHPAANLRVSVEAFADLAEREELPKSDNQLTLKIDSLRGVDHEFSWEITGEYLAEGFTLDAENRLADDYLVVVANETSGDLSVVALDSGEVVDTITIGETAGHGLAVSPDGSQLFAGDMETGILYYYDTAERQFSEELDLGAGIHGIDITPGGEYLFISPAGEVEENLIVVDVETTEIIKIFTDELAGSSSHVDFTPDGNLAVSAVLAENLVQIIEVVSLEVLADIEVGEGPNEARISPDGNYAYVANWESNELTVINMNDFSIVTNIPAGEGTHGVAVSPDGLEIWTANRRSNDITIISAETFEVQETIASGEYANHIKFTPDGRYVLVTNARAHELAVIDRQTREIVDRIRVGDTPHEITFIPGR